MCVCEWGIEVSEGTTEEVRLCPTLSLILQPAGEKELPKQIRTLTVKMYLI